MLPLIVVLAHELWQAHFRRLYVSKGSGNKMEIPEIATPLGKFCSHYWVMSFESFRKVQCNVSKNPGNISRPNLFLMFCEGVPCIVVWKYALVRTKCVRRYHVNWDMLQVKPCTATYDNAHIPLFKVLHSNIYPSYLTINLEILKITTIRSASFNFLFWNLVDI